MYKAIVTVSESRSKANFSKLPIWIPLLALLIIYLGTHISLLVKHDISASDFYLPTALAIVLVYWLGPKYIVPLVYLNSVANSYFWGNPLDRWPFWFLYAIPETLFVFLSWFLFSKLYRGKYWLPDTRNTVLFLLLGIFMPAIFESLLLQSMLLWTGDLAPGNYWLYVSSILLSEFSTSFFLTLPVLYYLSPWLNRKNLLPAPPHEMAAPQSFSKQMLLELGAVFACLLILTYLLKFSDFWFVYGFFSLYTAIRFGFGPSILANLFILLLVYTLPKLLGSFGQNEIENFQDVMRIFLGANLLFVFAALTGRVISDLRIVEAKLKKQNAELEKANEELDRYAYSVSHDLSAPLKSIQGLVNISRLSTDPQEHQQYLSRIEKSAKKLDTFIAEVLDYSRNKRQEQVVERISLQELLEQILAHLQEMPESNAVQVLYQLEELEIYQDKTRLRIILANLLSNALRFSHCYAGHQPYVKISSTKRSNEVWIEIEDNGIGIKPDQLDLIFQMFYRGHEKSDGSGLGLYIAREAAAKIQGSIVVHSRYGEGSAFTLKIRNLGPEAGKILNS